jgi:hypothetical protein
MATSRRAFVTGLGSLAAAMVAGPSWAQAPPPGTEEPVFRVSTANRIGKARHSLDRGLEIARKALELSRKEYDGYTATLVKRERIDGVVGEQEVMFIKVRNRKVEDGELVVPLSVYLTFLKPASARGREVIYVENQNNGKLVAHEGGVRGKFLPTVSLSPTGRFAMQGQRYPLTEIGLENLILKLIERGQTARQYPDVTAQFRTGAKIKDRTCTVLEVRQPQKRPDLDFYLAHIFIDDQLQIPVRYVAYDWPKSPQAKPEIIEEYTYLDVNMNAQLTDLDFDPENPAYNF